MKPFPDPIHKEMHTTNQAGLGILAALAALATLATTIILPTLPDMGRELSISTQGLSVTLSAFFIPFALGQLFVGPASDRLGRKRLLLAGLALLVMGSIVCAMANQLKWLILGRVVQGLGACAPSVLVRSIARDRFEGATLSRALSFIMVAMAAAPGFSPLLGGALSSVASWRSVFLLVAVLTAMVAWLYAKHIGETHLQASRKQVSVASSLVSYWQLLGNRRFIAPAMAVALAVGGLFAFFAATPAILMDGLSLSSMEVGYFFAATVFVVFSAGTLAPKLAARWSAVTMTMGGGMIALWGGISLLAGNPSVVHFSVSICIFLFGVGLLNPLCTTFTLQPFGAQAGAASALLGFLQIGVATLSILAISVLDTSAYQALSLVLTLSMVTALACLLLCTLAPAPHA